MHRTLRVLWILCIALLLSSCEFLTALLSGGTAGNTLLYVSTTGSDSNNGLAAATPLLSIATAVEKSADAGVEIRVASGTYTRGAGLPAEAANAIKISGKTNYSLTGGWDASFSAQSGTSVLQGPTAEEQAAADSTIYCRLVYVTGCTGFKMSGFTILRGTALGDGAGIYLDADGSSVENCIVGDCTANDPLLDSSNGGGIYVMGSGNVLEATVTGCVATNGGGIYLTGSEHSVKGTVGGTADGEGNRANKGGGIHVDAYGTGITVSCCLTGNKAVYGGGAYVLGSACTISGETSGNSATSYQSIGDFLGMVSGGGIYLAGTDNTLSAKVHGNTALYYSAALLSISARSKGGGVSVYGDGNTVTGDVYGNTATLTDDSMFGTGFSILGGGVYVEGKNVTVSGAVLDNVISVTANIASSNGAGISVNDSVGVKIASTVTGNTVCYKGSYTYASHGQGIYVYGSQDVSLSGATIGENGFSVSGSASVSGAAQQIYLISPTDDLVTGLSIESCTVSGSTVNADPGYAIFEGTQTTYSDVTGHTIRNNKFKDLDSLYCNYGSTAVTLAADAAGLALLNTAGDPSHGASVAEGNSLE